MSELLIREIIIWSYSYKVVNQGHVDKTAQGFNQSGNQTLESDFPGNEYN